MHLMLVHCLDSTLNSSRSSHPDHQDTFDFCSQVFYTANAEESVKLWCMEGKQGKYVQHGVQSPFSCSYSRACLLPQKSYTFPSGSTNLGRLHPGYWHTCCGRPVKRIQLHTYKLTSISGYWFYLIWVYRLCQYSDLASHHNHEDHL